MLFCIPTQLRDTDNHSGVILDMTWYERDPEENPQQPAILVDQVVLPAISTAQVTEAMIDDAIERRRPEVERLTTPPAPPPAPVKALLGRARVADGSGRPRAAADLRAERAAAERRAEATKGKKEGSVARGS